MPSLPTIRFSLVLIGICLGGTTVAPAQDAAPASQSAPDSKGVKPSPAAQAPPKENSAPQKLPRWAVDRLHTPESKGIFRIVFSPQDDLLATRHADQSVRIWNVAERHIRHQLKSQIEQRIIALEFSPDGKTLAWSGEEGQLELWDVASGKLRTAHKNKGTLIRFAGGKLISAGNGVWSWYGGDTRDSADSSSEQERSRLWNLIQKLSFQTVPLAISSDGRRLAMLRRYGDREIGVWEPNSPTRKFVLAGLRYHPGAISFSPGGRFLAAAGRREKSLAVWDVQRQVKVLSFDHKEHVQALAFSGDARFLAVGLDAGEIHLWN